MEIVSIGSAKGRLSAFQFPLLSYIFNYKKNVSDLASTVDDLSSMQKNIAWSVSEAKRKGEMIYPVVARWLKKVDRIQYDSNNVIDKARGINNCFQGWCYDRYALGKEAKQLMDMVIELLHEGNYLVEVSSHEPIQNVDLIPTEGIEEFESTKEARDLIMKALMNDQINIIGVHGMGGVGKTTLMKNIGNQVKLSKLFDAVIMVTVSQNQDLERIQAEIAEDLCFSFGKEKGESRSRRVYTRLKQERRVLIILDDIWKPLDLGEVGIPLGCKVVLTTRIMEVCSRMKSQEIILLRCLSELESRNLFLKSAGSDVDSPLLSEVARAVARKCKGLPVALVGLGRAMRDKDQSQWAHALQKLSEHETDFADIIDADRSVFQMIKLSYDFLPYEETKLVFLFCCLFPDNGEIDFDVLLMYMRGEGMFRDVSVKQARRKLTSSVDYLISSDLLFKADREGFVIMHGVVRDVAISIASKDHGFLVNRGGGLEAWPDEVLQKCIRLSLMGSEVTKLPEQPRCTALRTFTLSGCQSLKNIPDRFFEGMISLLNLDLSRTSISALPSSLRCLVNLRSLRLDHCYALKDITLIGQLKKLEMISLKGTASNTLPVRDIREFSDLRWLAMES